MRLDAAVVHCDFDPIRSLRFRAAVELSFSHLHPPTLFREYNLPLHFD